MRRLISLVPFVAGLPLVIACSSEAPAPSSSSGTGEPVAQPSLEGIEPGMHVQWQRGFQNLQRLGPTSSDPESATDNQAHGGGGSSGGNLVDHGGKVLSSSHNVAIYWGTPSAFPSDLKSGIASMFEGMNGSSFLAIGDQYMRGAKTSASYVTSYDDSSSSPPSRGPQTSAIVNEACHVINSNGLTPDTNAIYFVFTSNYPGGHVNYCAWHSHGTCNGVDIQVAYMPNTTGIAGCDPGNLYNCNTYSQGTRSIANVTSHEFMEAITDADINAWYDGSGSEIGDKCAWQFSSCVTLSTGNWQLQKEWSNSITGCAQQ